MSYENSTLEQALSEYVLVLSKWMRSHDRYVIIAFIASLIPFPPAGIASIFLSLIQLKLIRENKLPESSRKILHISILFSLTNFFLFGSIVYWVWNVAPIPTLDTLFNFLENMKINIFQGNNIVPDKGTKIL